MESTSVNLGKDGRKEEALVLKGRKLEAGKTLILKVRKSRTSASWRELFIQTFHGSNKSIPKHIITFDEKYVLRCLELIRNCALRATARNFTSKVDILPDYCKVAETNSRISSNSMGRLAIEYPLVGGTEVIMNSTEDWSSIGTVSRSQTMINILKSPLLQQFGSVDCDVDLGRRDLFDVSESNFSDFEDSLQESSGTVSRKLENKLKVCDHKRDASISSTNSSCSDHSSSSTYGTLFQGMLQCTWKDGLLNHVFTVNDKREVFVADLSKAKPSDGKGWDYIYSFHSRRNNRKECDVHELELEHVAKMRVSTSVTFSSNNSEVRETRFVLSVSSDNNHTDETETPTPAFKKNKKLTRKVVDVIRSSHFYKQRPLSKLGGSSTIFENNPRDPSKGLHNNCVDQGEGCTENEYAPHLEMAAIIVKDIFNIRKEAELGGWGLKFLKRPKRSTSLETASIPSGRSPNTGECSTSMDILIPAGFHGGPRTRVDGPSSLTERWISGGRCDCGGWDIGCPLTILNTRTDYSSRSDNSGDCKSVDLFMQGSKQNVPIMKLSIIHKGLYYIHFQSTLSTLQCFAIAAAVIHSHSPFLQLKV